KGTRLRANALRMSEMARIVIGDAPFDRMPSRSRTELDHELADVADLRGERAGALRPFGVVRQQLPVAFERRPAAGRIDDDLLEPLVLERLDDRARKTSCLFVAPRVPRKRAAAALLLGDDDVATFACEDADRRVIDVGKKNALHAAGDETDARPPDALGLAQLRQRK